MKDNYGSAADQERPIEYYQGCQDALGFSIEAIQQAFKVPLQQLPPQAQQALEAMEELLMELEDRRRAWFASHMGVRMITRAAEDLPPVASAEGEE